MEQLNLEERSLQLYVIQKLPSGMIYCTNQEGAMRLLNRGRTTIWRMIQEGQLRGFKEFGQVIVPLTDIASLLGITEQTAYNVLIAYRLPIWQYYED